MKIVFKGIIDNDIVLENLCFLLLNFGKVW